MNSVRLYSNGTAVISREYAFRGPDPLRITIPVRKTDLDDVISSLAVFGDVAITGPPTYSPTNSEESALAFDPTGALRALAMRLVGASVEVEAGVVYAGKLVGVQPHRRQVDRTIIDEYRLVILTERGVQQVEESSVTALRFTDAVVRAEVEKALRASLGRIKPDSSRVELTLRPNPGATGAVVTYATPVAAWKIRYQLRMTPEGAELDGQAVVDNDTDDDWAGAQITVITGEPITFSTDLAEARRPARGRLNVVADRTTGAVVAEPVMPEAASPPTSTLAGRGGYGGGGSYGGEMPQRARMASRAAGAAAARFERLSAYDLDLDLAEQPGAETRESGDFSVFTSPQPVDVGAGRSAIIPLFRKALGEARVVLLYSERDDARLPFRAIRFRNPGPHALGRGVCEVFLDGEFQGKCLLEATRPGEESLLVHAKETGVRVFKTARRPEDRRMAIRISRGAVVEEVLHRQRTTYRIRNSRPESLPLEIEHPRTRPDSDLRISVSSGGHEEAEIPSGRRIRVDLPAGGSLEVGVVEEQVEARRLSLDVSWLAENVISLVAPSDPDEGVRQCIDLQARIDGLQAEVREQEERAATIAEEQERLGKLIPQGHADQANAWRIDLAEAEKELREVKRSILPGLKARLKEAHDALDKALARLQYTWTKAPEGSGRPDQPTGSRA